jgi:hypothetical protein
MLRLRLIVHAAVAAVALGAMQPASAQGTMGLGSKLDAAEKKLDEDIKACRPIDVEEYRKLFNEAARNLKTLTKAAGAGAPVDTEQFKLDYKKSSTLLDRAKAAAAKPCQPPQQKPQQAPPPEKKVEPPKPTTPILGGGVTKTPKDPFDELQDEADDLLDELDEAMWECDLKWVQSLIPELERMAEKARGIADAAKALGKNSKVDPTKAASLAWVLDWALSEAKSFKACPKFKLVIPPEYLPKTTPKPEQPAPKTKPEEPAPKTAPMPSKISIVEDLVEPPTPAELKAIEMRVEDLGKTTRAYPKLLEGCHPDIWDKHIARLEQLAKRARQMAEWAKAPGQTTGVDAREAQRVADEAQKAVDEAKREKAANLEQWRAPECPKYELPQAPLGEPLSALPYQLSPFDARLLAIQNQERAAYHLQPLRWNPKLANDATAWAQQLAVTHQLVHAPREGRGIERENLQQGRIGWGPDRMLQNWLDEKRYFHPGIFPNVCAGDWSQCAHYTQVIWPTTTDVGCGMVNGGGFSWLVCRYSPGGNKDGKPVGLPYMPERG